MMHKLWQKYGYIFSLLHIIVAKQVKRLSLFTMVGGFQFTLLVSVFRGLLVLEVMTIDRVLKFRVCMLLKTINSLLCSLV